MSTAFSFSRDIDVAMPQQAFGGQADVLANIYEPQFNMAVWQRPLAGSVQRAIKQGINAGFTLNVTEEVPVSTALKTLQANYSLSQWQPA